MKIREITLSEAEAKVTRVGPDGVELTDPEGIKTTLPPEKMTALVPDANNPNKYSMNPQAMAADGDKPEGPKLGAEVDMATQEGMGANILGSLAVVAGLLGINTYNQEQALQNSPQLQQLVKMHAEYKTKGDEIKSSRIFINMDSQDSQLDTRDCIREEISGCLGAINDSWKYKNSTFYQGSNFVTEFSTLDKIIIHMIYND